MCLLYLDIAHDVCISFFSGNQSTLWLDAIKVLIYVISYFWLSLTYYINSHVMFLFSYIILSCPVLVFMEKYMVQLSTHPMKCLLMLVYVESLVIDCPSIEESVRYSHVIHRLPEANVPRSVIRPTK